MIFPRKIKILVFSILSTTLLTFVPESVKAENYFIRGIVKDSLSLEPLANAFVNVPGQKLATMTDGSGIFELTIPDKTKSLRISSQGYREKVIPVVRNRVNLYAVYLSEAPLELEEVVVKKRKYSKRDNPAVELMKHIRRTAQNTDPANKPFYSYDQYQRISLALNNIDSSGDKGLIAKFPFLIEHLDTSQISGVPILPVSVREESSIVYNRKQPKGQHVVVTGKRGDGIDALLDKESMDVFMNDVLGPIDIYSADINILQNRFVSPLSPIGADFYKYFITDSIVDSDGTKYYTLTFYPHNKATFGFNGSMQVAASDSAAFVKSVNMRVPSEINLNFIQNLVINQSFSRADDGSRLPVSDELIIEAQVIPGTQGLYARRLIDYTNHNFERPINETQIFRPKAPVTTLIDATDRDSLFWLQVNPVGLSQGERGVTRMLNRLRQNKVFYWGEKVVKALITG